ncbi:MAG TPA: adenylate/guanylate cyclase domain-containing protein [Candidatus Binatia bacterium]|nr:adenylate/guanylate cyclase domain-containing protein [Candidatus Binatia bacterium]
MRCAVCGTDLLPGKRFCHVCGTAVGQTCPRCSSPVRAEFRFCPDCGLELAAGGAAASPAGDANAKSDAAGIRPPGTASPPAPAGTSAAGASAPAMGGRLETLARQMPDALADKLRATAGASAGERKRATVMFLDLVGSTGIAAELDPEEYRELLERYLEICFREIYRFEGIVNQLAGDGMMALFGAPIAHEDAPERAVRAAVGIRDALVRFNAEAGGERGFELRTRFGINTGTVVVGAVGNDLKMDYTAIGDTTNVAARLEAVASPGAILVSDATARLVRHRFELRALEPLKVKGKSEPVIAYEVVRALDVQGPLAANRSHGLTPLVARDEELNQLVACWERLPGRLPQVVAIVGEAGSGKSRLLFELKQRLADRPFTLLEGRCSALSQMVPYAPWVAMMRQCYGVGPDEPADVALAKVRRFVEGLDANPDDLAQKLVTMFGGGDDDAVIPEEGFKRDTFEGMSRLVAGLCARGPVVIVLEDLHWIDDLSREMLETAVTVLYAYPIMVLVTHRPEYEPHWRATIAFTELRLRPLEDGAAAQLVRSVAGGELPAALEARILEKAEGNPLLLEEITRSLIEEGYLRRLDRRIELTRPVAEIQIPDTVQELIGARLDRLGSHGKRVAQVAAVLGRQFERDRLIELLAPEQIDVALQLDELERRGLLHRKAALSEDVYRFGESVTQELAYASLLLRDRRQLHERIARLMDDAAEMTPERSALLAHHWSQSEDRGRAVAALLRAARDAERLPSYGAAVRLYRRAWEIARADLEVATDAERERRVLDSALGLARLVMLYGTAEELGDIGQMAQQARGIAERLADDGARALLSLYEGVFRMSASGEPFEAGLELVERGLEIARAAGLVSIELSIARGLAWSYLFDGRFDAALAAIDEVIAGLARLDDGDRPSDLQFGARYMRHGMLLHVGRLTEAATQLAQTYELAKRHDNRTIRSASAASLAQLEFVRGRYEQALRWAEEAVEIGERIGNTGAIRPSAAVALGARLELGLPVNAARSVSAIDAGLASAGVLPLYVRIIAEALIAAGDVKAAERCVDQSALHSGGRLRQVANLSARGEVLLRSGSRHWREAEKALERAMALAAEIGALPARAAATVTAGELALALGDRRGAQSHLEEALQLSRRLDLGRYEARALRLLSEVEQPQASASSRR